MPTGKSTRSILPLQTTETIMENLQERFEAYVFVGKNEKGEREIYFHGDPDLVMGLCSQALIAVYKVDQDVEKEEGKHVK